MATTMIGTMMGTRIGTRMKNDKDRDKDRDKDVRGTDMPEGLGHEKLRVYQRGLDSVKGSFAGPGSAWLS